MSGPWPHPAPAPGALARAEEEAEWLHQALSRLKVAQRVLLHLRFREGLTYEQIARMEQLGDASRARRQVQSALDALRIELQRLPGKKNRQN